MQPKSSSDVTQAAAAAAVGGSMGVQFKSTKSKNKKTAHRSPSAAECRGSAMAAKASAPLVVWFVCSWICALCEDTQMIRAKPGGEVTLHCQGPDESFISVVVWKRSDLESSKYVYFFRDKRLVKHVQLPSYCDRVELRDPEMKNEDASVILKNVTVSDTGTYECCVPGSSRGRGKRATDIRQTINLEVTESGHSTGQTEDGGNLRAHVGLISSLVVVALVVCCFIFVVLVKRRSPQNSEQPAADGRNSLNP